jgi:hypothetical protein
MISANDLLQVISEIHQFSTLFIELRDATTYGILHSSNEKVNYFRFHRSMGRAERSNLVRELSSGTAPQFLEHLSVEDFLREVEGKKARHIWLETRGKDRRELAFLSIAELKMFFQSHSRR